MLTGLNSASLLRYKFSLCKILLEVVTGVPTTEVLNTRSELSPETINFTAYLAIREVHHERKKDFLSRSESMPLWQRMNAQAFPNPQKKVTKRTQESFRNKTRDIIRPAVPRPWRMHRQARAKNMWLYEKSRMHPIEPECRSSLHYDARERVYHSEYSVKNEFKRSRVDFSNEFRYGRLSTAVNKNIDAVRRMLETDRHTTYHEIRASLDIGMNLIQSLLHKKLGMKRLCSRCTPQFD
ncbi:hypothetical protein EVAR_59771_1 [Eumeta japonica]|uniref:Uncharacterized protein n=1 Tax=Eumeta variegata TaxID=151549 RepID=A0A4C1ZJ20_EUMVA|nr:hypothetical protein EVAR_59771_1 [Eumeta japonica]